MQDFGLQLLEWIDTYREQQDKADREARELKLALLSANRVDPAKAFPEIFTDDGEDDDDIDYSDVEWAAPSDVGIDEYERTMALLAQHSTITTTDSEPSDLSTLTPEVVKAPPQRADEPDDVEWI